MPMENDLISRKAVLEAIQFAIGMFYDADLLKETIDMLPAAQMRRGKWIEYPECLQYDGAYSDDHIVCSACKSVWSILDNDTERFNYCPKCGAKMDGGEDE